MSSNSHVIQTNRSMIILDKNGMPVNLGNTVREDYPENQFPILAYDGKNVLPTALGYKSFFAENTRLNVGDILKDLKVQQLITFQSATMSNLFIALCEDGLYVANATEEVSQFPWVRIVDLSLTVVAGVRRQWTMCVIANILYLYQQGSEAYYTVVDLATYEETAIPTGITGASITKHWKNDAIGAGIHKVVPNFINMSGQIGLFKAGNRLGFWDSDGAVAWSSATQRYDFKPSISTFAGVTTFTDVVGTIVMIKQHGNGFIIYATKSVTLALPMQGSPERWSGQAIFNDVGVIFDIQVAMAQPDTIHYAITSGGLCRIRNGTPEFIEPEVMDYVRKENILYALSVIDTRYLVIHAANEFVPSTFIVEGIDLSDFDGNEYLFPKPSYDPLTLDPAGLVKLASGKNGVSQDGFASFTTEGVDPFPHVVSGDYPLVPCYNTKEFDSTWADTVFDSVTSNHWIVPSKLASGMTFRIEPGIIEAVVTVNSYYLASTKFDQAGQDFLDSFNLAISRYTAHANYEQAYIDAIANFSVDVNLSVNLPSIYNHLPNGSVYEWTGETITETRVPYLIGVSELKAVANECHIALSVDEPKDLLLEYKFAGTESIIAGLNYAFFDGEQKSYRLDWDYVPDGELNTPAITGIETYNINLPKVWICWSLSDEDKAEFELWQTQQINDFTYLSTQNYGSTDASSMYSEARHIAIWVAKNKPNAIKGGNVTAQELIDRYPNGHSGTMVEKNLAQYRYSSQLDFYDVPGYDEEAAGGSGILFSSEPLIIRVGTHTGSGLTRSVFAPLSNYGDSDRWATRYNLPGADELTLGANIYLTEMSNVADPWTITQRNSIYGQSGFPSSTARKYVVKGRMTIDTRVVEPEFTEAPVQIFDAELSGYGYYPSGGFSFRKTHKRHSSTSCPVPTQDVAITGPLAPVPGGSYTGTPPVFNGEPIINPPYNWEYPDAIPLLPNYVLFQKGTISPYYQTYENALVLDTQLEKWGRYNNKHKVMYSLLPVNRTDQGIIPVADQGMRGGALSEDGWCSIFTDRNPNAVITYGKIGEYRKGVSMTTNLTAQFEEIGDGNLVVEVSSNGATIDTDKTRASDLGVSRFISMPFTEVGKWFNIRLEGIFNLVGLSLESKRSGRR